MEFMRMKINRHNYEAFFILYWDQELSAHQQKEVEDFVRDNSDLQEEFNLIGKARLQPDSSLVFEDKDLLLFDENTSIHPGNYPELLLSYIDDELTGLQQSQVERFIANHSWAQKELALLQKTKLQPDSNIIFPDKQTLYRKAEKTRVIRMIWRRVAVAAMVLFIAGLATFTFLNKSNPDEIPEITKAPVTPDHQTLPTQPVEKTATATIQPVDERIVESSKTTSAVISALSRFNRATPDNADNKNNLPKANHAPDIPVIAEQPTPVITPEFLLPDASLKGNEALALTEPVIKNPLFDNADVTERTSPTYTVYTPQNDEKTLEKNGGGLKGFLRKATRVIEHRTKIRTTTDDNKLLVGVFAVSLQ